MSDEEFLERVTPETDDAFLLMCRLGSLKAIAAKLGCTTQTVGGRRDRILRTRALDIVSKFVDWVDDDSQAMPSSELVNDARELLENIRHSPTAKTTADEDEDD